MKEGTSQYKAKAATYKSEKHIYIYDSKDIKRYLRRYDMRNKIHIYIFIEDINKEYSLK